MRYLLFIAAVVALPTTALASSSQGGASITDLTGTVYGYLGIIIFVLAYSLVPLENNIHLRKSKPVLFAAGVIWVLVAIAYIQIGDTHTAHEAIKASLLEYAELFLFLLVAMLVLPAASWGQDLGGQSNDLPTRVAVAAPLGFAKTTSIVGVMEALARIERVPKSKRVLRELPPTTLRRIADLLNQAV